MNTVCTAARHGTLAAYVKAGCRCPDACQAYSQYRREWRAERYALGVCGMCEPTIPLLTAGRIVRGLHHLGHTSRTIAEAAQLSSHTVRRLARCEPGQRIHRHTARAIGRAVCVLVNRPGRSRYARDLAAFNGWAPLHAWDAYHLPMDDPTIPDRFAATVADQPPPARGHLLTAYRAAAAHTAHTGHTTYTARWKGIAA